MASGFWKIIDEAAARSDFRPDLTFWRGVWPYLVGSEMALRSMPCGWHGTTLEVEVEPGAWRKAFEDNLRTVRARVDRLPWEVESIILHDGYFPDARLSGRPPRDLDAVALPADAAELLADLELDPGIADLAGRIRRHLEWEKKVGEDG